MPVGGQNGSKSVRSKKRKRSGTIKGVPADLTPLLLAAVKKGSQALQYHVSRPHSSYSTLNASFSGAVTLFLDMAKLETNYVHVACLTFLLDSVENIEFPWELRISALRVAEAVLLRSKAARKALVEDRLSKFVNVLSQGTGQVENRTVYAVQLQEETAHCLSVLSSRFGYFYPRLTVACRWMDEKKYVRFPTNTNQAMDPISLSVLQQRKGRDTALNRGDDEYEIVKKLVSKVDECFKRLVPNFLRSTENDDELDSIDWEDGDEKDVEEIQDGLQKDTDYKAAIDRTIISMGIRDNIEIDFSKTPLIGLTNSDNKTKIINAEHKYRSKLEKYMKMLYKHRQRVERWIESLLSADDGPVSVSEESLKKNAVKVTRKATLDILLESKNEMTRVIAQATKLGIHQEPTKSNQFRVVEQTFNSHIAWSK